MSEQKTSSIAYKDVKRPESDQLTMGTWTVAIPILFIAFFVLKFFIYIKDDKRAGK